MKNARVGGKLYAQLVSDFLLVLPIFAVPRPLFFIAKVFLH